MVSSWKQACRHLSTSTRAFFAGRCQLDMTLGRFVDSRTKGIYELKETNCLLPLVGWEGQVIFYCL